MTHLTAEQFEDALAGDDSRAGHLSACEACRSQLAQSQALRARLRRSFDSLQASPELAQRLGRQVAERAAGSSGRGARSLRLRFRWPAVAAAAAAIVAAVLIVQQLGSPKPVMAAQAELAAIHQRNISGSAQIFTDNQPEKLKEYLQSRTKRMVPLLQLGQGMKVQGCCMARFKDKDAPSYVVTTTDGPVSIIILDDHPDSMGMSPATSDGRTFWHAAAGECRMCSVICPCGHSFYAVGNVPAETLSRLLAQARSSCCPA